MTSTHAGTRTADIAALLISLVAVGAVALVGGLASANAGEEYRLLDQPSCGGLDVETLAAMLRQYAADYERDQPGNEWPDYYARRLIAAAA